MASLNDNALTTYLQVKDYLGLTDDANEAFIIGAINTASGLIANVCGREFNKKERTELYVPPEDFKLLLDVYPVASIAEIRYDGDLVDPSLYTLIDAAKGIVWRNSGWQKNYMPVPGSTAIDLDRNSGKKVLSVKYTGGYVLPKDAVGISVIHVGTGTGVLEASGIADDHNVVCTVRNGTSIDVAVDGGAPVSVVLLPGSSISLGAYAGLAAALGNMDLTFTRAGTWIDGDTYSFAITGATIVTRDLPMELEQACKDTVRSIWRRRGVGFGDSGSESQLNVGIGRGLGGIIPDEAMLAVRMHKRVL